MPRVGKRGLGGYQARRAAEIEAERARVAGQTKTTRELNPFDFAGDDVAPSMPWAELQALIERTGAPLDEILAHPKIPSYCLQDPRVLEILRDVVERAQRVFRLRVRESLADKGIDGKSVTALLGIARNTAGIDFDKQQGPTGAGAPDVAQLELKIDELLTRLERKRADEQARPPLAQPAVPVVDVEAERA